MTQTSSQWHDLSTVKKGDIGEKIVCDYLEGKGYVIYQAKTDKPHIIDYFAHSENLKKKFWIEVKTKPRRISYPDTGFDFRHYERYRTLDEDPSCRVFVFFVDETLGEVYGNYLSILDEKRVCNNKTYPFNQETQYGRNIRYFPLEAMQRGIIKLSDEQINKLKNAR